MLRSYWILLVWATLFVCSTRQYYRGRETQKVLIYHTRPRAMYGLVLERSIVVFATHVTFFVRNRLGEVPS